VNVIVHRRFNIRGTNNTLKGVINFEAESSARSRAFSYARVGILKARGLLDPENGWQTNGAYGYLQRRVISSDIDRSQITPCPEEGSQRARGGPWNSSISMLLEFTEATLQELCEQGKSIYGLPSPTIYVGD